MTLKIACVYPDAQMPTAWFQFCRRLRVEARRAGFGGRIDIVRRSDIADDVDVLAVMPSLFDEVAFEYGDSVSGPNPKWVFSLGADDKAGFVEFVKLIADESPSTSADEHGTTLAVHRGFQKVGSRVELAASHDSIHGAEDATHS